MVVIIGSATKVTAGSFGCVTSLQWSVNQNIQYIYCLGGTTYSKVITKPTQTLSITSYVGSNISSYSNTIETTLSQSCSDDAPNVDCSVSLASCSSTIASLSGYWYITQYSFSKGDATMPGQETWSLQQWLSSTDVPLPSAVLLQSAEGQNSGDGTGVRLITKLGQGSSGSVSANQVGQADITYFGQVSLIGGATLGVGKTGNASASLGVTPVYY